MQYKSESRKQSIWRDAFSMRVTKLLIMVIVVLLSAAGFAYYFRQNEEKRLKLSHQQVLQEQLNVLEEESKRLDQLVAMAGQPQYIERIARDELGMVRPDEKVFKDVR